MAYVDPTSATLKARFPAFASVDDAVVSQAITEAMRSVDQTWTEGDYTLAIMLRAAHILTLDDGCRLLGFGREGLLYHDCDATKGDSGSPILGHRDGRFYILAIHVATGVSAKGAVGIAVPGGVFAKAAETAK